MMDNFFIPYATINPNYITFYEKSIRPANYYEAGLKLNHSGTGELSRKGSKRVKDIVSWFVELSKEQQHVKAKHPINYKLTFATLTLPSPQKHTDQDIKKKMLSRFLIYAGRKWNTENYLWRAEAQENGNIHFHITFDKYIEHSELRQVWNDILSDYGYVQAYTEKMKSFFSNGFRVSDNPKDKRTEQQQRKAYETGLKDNWSNPNSTDIHSLYKVKNVAAYLAKYVSKNIKIFIIKTELKYWKIEKLFKDWTGTAKIETVEGGYKVKLINTDLTTLQTWLELRKVEFKEVKGQVIRAIKGRLWFASDNLRKLKNLTVELTAGIHDAVGELIKQSGVDEKICWIKNKLTFEMEPSRFVKMYVGKLFTFRKTEEFNFSVDSKADTKKITPILERITEHIKNFFQPEQEPAIA